MIDKYTADDIDLLEGLDGVRKRPAMYIGSTSSVGLHHLVWEIVDNAVDEAMNGFGDKITITLHKDGSVSVSDEGRGIPCDINKKTGLSGVQLIFTNLHSGGKFSDKLYNASAGLHGVGSTVVNALSTYCDITIYRDGKIHHIRFENGGSKLAVPLEIIGTTRKTGTTIRFKPDPLIFKGGTDFKWETIYNRIQESAFLINCHFIIKDERTDIQEEFYYEKGLKAYVETFNQNKRPIDDVLLFEDKDSDIQISVALQYCYEDYSETIFSYANNVRTRDGGTHETGFRTGITRAVNDFAEENNLLKGKMKLEGTDIREGLTAVVLVRIPEKLLEYEGQTKGKLGTSDALNAVSNFVYTRFKYYLNENNAFAVNLIKKCIDSQTARIAARKARDEARSTKSTKKEVIVSDKLTPAQSKDYKLNELFIVEGESAGGSARKGRDRIHQAILPLRGKPLNTDGVTMDRMLKNEEFSTIIATIGAGVGQSFDVKDSHYGKVIIMTDADTDGAHIQTLLLTFFYRYMKELITAGMVYVAVPPLYRVAKEVNKKMVYKYAWDDEGLAEAKKEIGPGGKIQRYKGLGEMNAEQLKETTMDQKNRKLIKVRIDDPLLVEKRVGILMGKDASVRRQWVEENVDFTLYDSFIEEVKK